MKKNRADGMGWDWGWADFRREWMEATPEKYAYRCLPLTIVNQTGWIIRNPVGFTALWNGDRAPGTIEFWFDREPQLWKQWVNSQFGEGIITWNTPFLFRTRPPGSRLLVMGPTNRFKQNAHPLTALIESDWISMSFTMNYRLFTPGERVRFDAGEPLFQVIPMATNVCQDLEDSDVTYMKLGDNPEVEKSYRDWSASRQMFHSQKKAGEVKPGDWQKDYFRGGDQVAPEIKRGHKTKITPPQIQYRGTAKG